ncbi:uncharacterized protein LOC143063023 [Mytilus galloprovincialis]|uniref:uncharacterized protein LOC143063023 n=1 Tax=Mytilus galloprovincialis TaxID=29158 RepID=UPI003F7C9C73
MMVAAFTTRPGVKKNRGAKVITTDIGNNTTLHFNQNFAAAPMVSGAVALALSANPSLTYRDIMHLLVNTARGDLLQNKSKTKFLTNAAGFLVSSHFGFGLLDIGALVDRSKTWELVPDRQSCHSTEIIDNPLNQRSKYFVVKVSGCNVTYVEHVEVSLIVTHQNAGQIQWTLVSPNRTNSIILPGRILDQTTTMNLTVLTVHMWGENPEGYWKLKPKPMFGKNLNKGTVKSVKLLIHGYSCGNKCKLQPAQQALGDWKKWSRWSECTVLCGNKTRSRQCKNNNNLKYCPGKNFETVPCDQSECQLKRISEVQSGECPLAPLLISRCVEQCSNDSDCSVNQKCCYNGCGHSCEMSKTKVQSGECPVPSRLISRCVEQCSTDSDCSGKQKCCDNGCGHSCENSTTYPTKETIRATSEQDQTKQPVRTTSKQVHTANTVRTKFIPDKTTQTTRTTPKQDRTTKTVRTTSVQEQTTQTVRITHKQEVTIWSVWSQWSNCNTTMTCGHGIKIRERTCAGTCIGDNREVKLCFIRCPDHICIDTYKDCSVYLKMLKCYDRDYAYDYCRKSCGLCQKNIYNI